MLDNNQARLARAIGEYTVPAAGESAVYRASSWTRLGKSREFTTYRTRPDETPVELTSASISGTAVEFPTTSDPEVAG